jgi:hypothetical protein
VSFLSIDWKAKGPHLGSEGGVEKDGRAENWGENRVILGESFSKSHSKNLVFQAL